MKEDQQRAKNRPTRVPLHKQNVFTAEQRDGFKRYWVNETPGMVESYQLAGWNLVADGTKTHDQLSQVESQMGSVVRRVVNKDPQAPCKTAVLMEIPIQLYEEDQADEQRRIDEIEQSFDQTGEMRKRNLYGNVNVSHRNNI